MTFLSRYSLFAVAICVVDVLAQSCKGGEFSGSPYESLPNTYCLFFLPGEFTYDAAENFCRTFDGRLVDINTRHKAQQAANIMEAVFKLNPNRAQNRTAWLSSLYIDGDDFIWERAQTRVSGEAKEPGEPEIENEQACAVFDSKTETWKYSTCKGNHSVLCQENDLDIDLLPENVP